MNRAARTALWALPAAALLGFALLLWIVSHAITTEIANQLAMQRVHVEHVQQIERAAEAAHLSAIERWVSDNTRRELRDQQALEAAQALRTAAERLGKLAPFDDDERTAAGRLMGAAVLLSNQVMQALYTTDTIGTTSELEMAMDTLRSHASTTNDTVSRAGSSTDRRLGALRTREVAIEIAFIAIALAILLVAITHSQWRLRASERLRRVEQQAAIERAQFFANMSHELRTPLVAIRGFATLIGAVGSLDAESASNARQIEGQSQELLGIINNILEASKLGTGEMQLETEAVDATELIGRSVQRCRGLIADKPIELSAEVAAGLRVLGDFVKLQQVMINLIGNAIKFTERGQVQVRARVRDGRALIEVADTGCGIPGDALEHIWQPFRQAAASTARKHGGTGLGLAIVRGLVERMGGRVEVASIVGMGSTFSLWLPLAAEVRA
jgi:signal transduction histidine kinase